MLSTYVILSWSLCLAPSWPACLQTAIYCVVCARAFLTVYYFGTNCNLHTHHLKSGSQSHKIQICDMLFQSKNDFDGLWSVILVDFWPRGSKITFVRGFSRFVLELLLVLHRKTIIDVNWIGLKIQTGGLRIYFFENLTFFHFFYFTPGNFWQNRGQPLDIPQNRVDQKQIPLHF